MAVTINGNGTITGITSGAGKLVQIAKSAFTGVNSSTTINSWTDAASCSVSITPNSSSNKIIGIFNISHGSNVHHHLASWRVVTGSTVVSDTADASGGAGTFQGTIGATRQVYDTNSIINTQLFFVHDLSSWSSGSLTFKVQRYSTQSGTYYINRSHGDGTGWGRGSSTFILMEVDG